MSKLDYETFPQLRNLQTGIVVDLNPGDVLFIPPFYYHYVTALTTSVSLSFWTDAEELGIYSGISDIMLPFDEDWSKEEYLHAGGLYASVVLQMLSSHPREDFFPPENIYDQLLDRYKETLPPSTYDAPIFECHCNFRPPFEEKRFLKRGEVIVDLFNRIHDKHVRAIYVINWIEEMTSFLLGGVELLPKYILDMKHCWAYCSVDS
jgi:hypothetical protein